MTDEEIIRFALAEFRRTEPGHADEADAADRALTRILHPRCWDDDPVIGPLIRGTYNQPE